MAYFDAVGTLLFPEPVPGEAYFRAGQRFGSAATRQECGMRFGQAFAAQEALDAANGHRTSEERERQRWRAIVAQVLPDVSDAEACFVSLWDLYADPARWRLADEAGAVLRSLCRRGLRCGLASNFDQRLIGIVQAKEALRDHLDAVVASSAIGWKKPARGFFDALAEGYGPHEVLMVGDDLENDYRGAQAAGLHAILLDDKTALADLID